MLFWLDIDDAPFARKGSMVVIPKSEDQTDCAGNLALRDSGFGSIGDKKAP
ncbi:hypothetical protein [Sphingomonas sp. NFR15]|uniref:hypothetical protein n=1 Tax=Sphingomonas sp. NFR15 TaxID=1566282 RepID=UPI0015A15A05|nr:hypothetical protein [Sphingomonas sp. NFR15]